MKYVVIGSSAAGMNGAREVRRLDKDAEIVLISKDETVYSRCIMHHYICGIRTLEELSFVEKDFFEKYNIEFINGTEAVDLDVDNKVIKLSNDEEISYDRVLIASGAKPFFPPIKNLDKAGNAFGFRDMSDTFEILDALEDKKDVVVVGGGLVGIDFIAGLVEKEGADKNISLVEIADRLLPMQLDKRASSTYEELFEERGVDFYLDNSVQEVKLDDEENVKSIVLASGEELSCDVLIVAAGVRPNTEFLKNTDIELERGGLVIDPDGRTSHPDVFGAGDVTGWGPIWPVAVKEGIIAGSNMVGEEREMTDFFASKSTMNYFDVPSMSIGMCQVEDDSYLIEIEEDNKGNYKKIIHKDGKIYGAILQGDLSYAGTLTQLLKENIDVSKVKKSLFDIDYSDFFHVKDNFEFSYEEE